MAEEKKDSFWESKNDDFWSTPVVSEDWLKSDADSFWGNHQTEEKTQEEPLLLHEEQGIQVQQKKSDQWQRHREVKGVQDNPYIQHYTSEQMQDILEGKRPRKKAYDQISVSEKTKLRAPKKHIHTKICLAAMGMTVLVVLAFIFAAKWSVHTAKVSVSQFTGTEQAAGNEIVLAGNDVMYLEDVAYTIVPEFWDELWADDVKLVVAYVQLFSDYFEDYQKNDLSPYIGYNTEYGREYRTMYNSWDIDEKLIGNCGFSSEQVLYSRVGKGYDSAGYYFFTVPTDVTEIDFYVETYSYHKNCNKVEKTYVKSMRIEDRPDLEELLSRKVVR